jgi:hypothetical protein
MTASGDLAQVVAEIDFISGDIVGKRLLRRCIDSMRLASVCRLTFSPRLSLRFEAYEGDDQLQIVLHAMLQLRQQDVLVAGAARILLALRDADIVLYTAKEH